MQKKDTHKYTSVAVSYRNTMPYKISGLFTHFFERIFEIIPFGFVGTFNKGITITD